MYNPELQRFGGFNSAIYDSQMLGISDCTNQNVLSGNADSAAVKAAFVQLFDDAQYVGSVQRATSDETAVRRRIEKAVAAFDAI